MADASIQEFIAITGVDEDRAKFYLQSANGELHVALETFYDNDIDNGVEASPESTHERRENTQQFVNDTENLQEMSSTQTSSSSIGTRTNKKGKSPGRFATISNFQDDDSDNEEGQAFYAGGSETSGQQILGPDKTKKKNEVSSIFDAAKTHGAEVVPETNAHAEIQRKKKENIFRGAGYKLGSEVEPSEQVSSSAATSSRTENRTIAIKFWKNGFCVDDGPLRDLHDPQNKEFLESIRKGEVPSELRTLVTNGEVHVNLEDHSEEEFVKPKPVLKPFSGQGRVLGSPAPNFVENQKPEESTSTYTPCSEPTFEVNRNKPVTTIQIRFADGTRLVSKFNHDNTIGDVRRLVLNAKPTKGSSFKLMTTFPNKVLEDDNQTLEEAKLLNAVIVQRIV